MESSADSEQAFRPGDVVAWAFLRAWARWKEGVREGRLRGGATSAQGAGAWQEGGIRAGYTPIGANGVWQGVGPLALQGGRGRRRASSSVKKLT